MELELLEDDVPLGRVLRDGTAVFDLSDSKLIKRYRMPRPLLLELCQDLEPVLGTQERGADLPVSLRLAAALRVYAEGNFQRVSGDLAGISQPSVSRAVAQVSAAIIATKLNLIKFPATAQERETTKAKFMHKFGFPNVLGAIDGTHVAIKSPTVNEHLYVNRHQRHSINVQAVCDANMLFTDVVAKFPGATHDSYMFASSALGQKMEQSGGEEGYLLGDSGYALRPWMITSFDQAAANIPEKAAFNKIHSKTRGVIERSFGILKSRFRCLDDSGGVLQYAPAKACQIITAVFCLHNLCVMHNIPLDEAPIVDEAAGGHDHPAVDEAEDAYQRGRDIRQQLITMLTAPNRMA